MLSWVAISALSHPCNSKWTICCSRGPSRTVCSFIPSSPNCEFASPGQVYGFTITVSGSIHVAILWLFRFAKRKTLFHRDLRMSKLSRNRKLFPTNCRIAVLHSHKCRKNAPKYAYRTTLGRHSTLTFTHCSVSQRRELRGFGKTSE